MTEPTPHPVAEHSEPNIYTSLTHEPLNPQTHLAHVRSPSAGALVLFAGTTRATFDDRPVANLTYQAYVPLALATLTSIARAMLSQEFPASPPISEEEDGKSGEKAKGTGKGTGRRIQAIAISHRLGVVPIGEESILIAVSAAHRTEAWRAGEACLEEVKKRTEIWKLETFADEEGEAVWRANNSNPGGGGGQNIQGERGEAGPGEEGEGVGTVKKENQVPETMGPVIRPRRPGEAGHGAVVHPLGSRAPPGEQPS